MINKASRAENSQRKKHRRIRTSSQMETATYSKTGKYIVPTSIMYAQIN
mgnify:CR=1 FL=1